MTNQMVILVLFETFITKKYQINFQVAVKHNQHYIAINQYYTIVINLSENIDC
jgi:hypothetical protein